MAKVLKVGDVVLWKGGWGSEAPKRAKVTHLDRTEQPREKYGHSVSEIDWADKDYAVVSLDNGHWAYGEQLEPLF